MGNTCSMLSSDERPKHKKRSNAKTKQAQTQQRSQSKTPSTTPSGNSSTTTAATNSKQTPAQQRLTNKGKKNNNGASAEDTFVVAPRQQQKTLGVALSVEEQRKSSNTSDDRNRLASVGGVSSGPKSPHHCVAPRTISPGGDCGGNPLNVLQPVQMTGSELCASSSLGAVVFGTNGSACDRGGQTQHDGGGEASVPLVVVDILSATKPKTSPPPRTLHEPGGDERAVGSSTNSNHTVSDTVPYPGTANAAKNPFMSSSRMEPSHVKTSSASAHQETTLGEQQPSRGGAHFSALDFNATGHGGSAPSFCPTFGSSQSFSSAGSVADSFGSRRISAALPTALELPRLESVGTFDEREVKIPKKWRAQV